MRLLQVFHGSNLVNGVDRVTLTLTEGLLARGVEVVALVPEAGAVTQALRELGVPFHCAPLQCCTPQVSRARLRYYAAAARRTDLVADLIRRERIDVVHANTGHMIDVALATALCRVPLLWHLHSPIEIDHARYTPHLDLAGYAEILDSLATRLLVVSNDMAASVRAHLPHKIVDVLYNGVDLDALQSSAAIPGSPLRDELGVQSDIPLVLGIGRISAQKDFAAFARVAGRVVRAGSPAHFVIAGPREEPEAVAALEHEIAAAQLGKRVHVLGARDDVPRLISASDLVLSTALFEGLSVATIEALGLGRPVVAMACVGLRECITDGVDGRLVPPGDEEGTAEAVLALLADRAQSRRLGQGGVRTAHERFSREAFTDGFIAIALAALQAPAAGEHPALVPLAQALLRQIAETEARVLAMEQRGSLSLLDRIRERVRAPLPRPGQR